MVSAESKKGGGIAATAEYCTNGEQCQVSSVPCSRDGSLPKAPYCKNEKNDHDVIRNARGEKGTSTKM